MRIRIWYLMFPLISSIATAQDEESLQRLKTAAEKLSGIGKASIYVRIADKYFHTGFNPPADSIYKYAERAVNLAGKDKKIENEAATLYAYALFQKGKKDQAIAIQHNVIQTSLASAHYIGHAHGFLSNSYFGINIDSTLFHQKKALRFFIESSEKTQEVLSRFNLGMLYSSQNNYSEAVNFLQESMTYGKLHATARLDDWTTMMYIRSLLLLLDIYINAGDLSTAKQLAIELENFYKKHKVGISLNSVWMTIYCNENKLDSALYFTRSVTEMANNPLVTARTFASTYLNFGKYRESLPFLNAAIDTFRAREIRLNSVRPKQNLMEVLTSAASAHFNLGNYNTARSMAKEALTYFQHYGSYLNELSKTELLATNYRSAGESDSALFYLEKWQHLKDSILDRKFIFKLSQLQKQLEQEKSIAKINLLEKENQIKEQRLREQFLIQVQKQTEVSLLDRNNKLQQKKLEEASLKQKEKENALALLKKSNETKEAQLQQDIFLRKTLFGSVGILVIISLIVFRNLRLKRNNERLLREQAQNQLKLQQLESEKKQAQLKEEAMQLKMLALKSQMSPHFVFNCLSSINWLILANNTQAASDYLTRFSRLIRLVLMNSNKSLISLEDELATLKLYLQMEQLRFEQSFQFTIKEDEELDTSSLLIPPMILQPFCENAIWHGLMHKNGGKLEVAIHGEKDYIFCTIRDNGIGRKKSEVLNRASAKKYPSLGLSITSSRIQAFNGSSSTAFEFEDLYDVNGDAAGTKVSIRLKSTTDVSANPEILLQ